MKRLLIAIMILAMVFSMAGCSSAAAPANWEVGSYDLPTYGGIIDATYRYVEGAFEGTCDSSSSEDNELTGKMLYYVDDDPTACRFRLFEYGSSEVKISSPDHATLHLKIKGKEYTVGLSDDLSFYSTLYGTTERESFILDDERETVWLEFMSALENGETISCYIVVSDKAEDHFGDGGGDGTKYKFKLNGSGFAEQLALVEQ